MKAAKVVMLAVYAAIAVLWVTGLAVCIWAPGDDWTIITTAWGDYLIATVLALAFIVGCSWSGYRRGRTWYCEAEGVGMESVAGVCNPEHRFHHQPPCGWQ